MSGPSRDSLRAVTDEDLARQKPPTLPSVLWQLAGLIFRREALLVVAACVVLLGVGGAGVVWAQAQLDGGTDKAVAPVAEALKVQTVRMDQHLLDDAAFKREMARRQDEASADIRALYKTVLTGERQYRLERPLPPPDGGP